MSLEKLDLALEKIQSEHESFENEKEPYNETGKGSSFDLDSIVYQIEKIGNDYLRRIHEDLALDDSNLKLHSEMTAVVLEKNLNIEALKNTPEYTLAGLTLVICAEKYRTFEKLKEQGEI